MNRRESYLYKIQEEYDYLEGLSKTVGWSALAGLIVATALMTKACQAEKALKYEPKPEALLQPTTIEQVVKQETIAVQNCESLVFKGDIDEGHVVITYPDNSPKTETIVAQFPLPQTVVAKI